MITHSLNPFTSLYFAAKKPTRKSLPGGHSQDPDKVIDPAAYQDENFLEFRSLAPKYFIGFPAKIRKMLKSAQILKQWLHSKELYQHMRKIIGNQYGETDIRTLLSGYFQEHFLESDPWRRKKECAALHEELAKRLENPEHPLLAPGLVRLADWCLEVGRAENNRNSILGSPAQWLKGRQESMDEALSLYDQAYKLLEKQLGPESAATINVLEKKADLHHEFSSKLSEYKHQSNLDPDLAKALETAYQQEEALLREIIQRRKKAFGEKYAKQNYSLRRDLDQLGKNLRDQKRYDDAIACFNEAISKPMHPQFKYPDNKHFEEFIERIKKEQQKALASKPTS